MRSMAREFENLQAFRERDTKSKVWLLARCLAEESYAIAEGYEHEEFESTDRESHYQNLSDLTDYFFERVEELVKEDKPDGEPEDAWRVIEEGDRVRIRGESERPASHKGKYYPRDGGPPTLYDEVWSCTDDDARTGMMGTVLDDNEDEIPAIELDNGKTTVVMKPRLEIIHE